MKTQNKVENSIDLSAVPDSVLFEAAANRLRSAYQRIHGIDFTFGFFSFVSIPLDTISDKDKWNMVIHKIN